MVVKTTASGRNTSASGGISPGWEMPTSNTPKRVSSPNVARDSGMPSWLLRLATVRTVGPTVDRASATSSLVVVLPTEPAMATMVARPANSRR